MKKKSNKKINLSQFYKEHEKLAVISYRAFTDRVKSKKYSSLLEALTKKRTKRNTNSKKIKEIEKEIIIRLEALKEKVLKKQIDKKNSYKEIRKKEKNKSKKINLFQFYKEHEELAVISYRTFTDRAKSDKYSSLLEALTKEKNKKSRKEPIKKEKYQKKKEIVEIEEKKNPKGITKKDFYNKYVKRIEGPVVSYKTFCNKTVDVPYDKDKWFSVLMKKKGVIIQKKRKKREKIKQFFKSTSVEKTLQSYNILDSLSPEEKELKKREALEKIKSNKKNYYYLYNKINCSNKKGTIKGIYFILDRV